MKRDMGLETLQGHREEAKLKVVLQVYQYIL